RTISLGICAIQAAMRPDLRCGVSASDRGRPFVTGVNGTADCGLACPDGCALVSPILLDSCHPLGRGRCVKAREATACGLALTRRIRPRQSSSEEDDCHEVRPCSFAAPPYRVRIIRPSDCDD